MSTARLGPTANQQAAINNLTHAGKHPTQGTLLSSLCCDWSAVTLACDIISAQSRYFDMLILGQIFTFSSLNCTMCQNMIYAYIIFLESSEQGEHNGNQC